MKKPGLKPWQMLTVFMVFGFLLWLVGSSSFIYWVERQHEVASSYGR